MKVGWADAVPCVNSNPFGDESTHEATAAPSSKSNESAFNHKQGQRLVALLACYHSIRNPMRQQT